MEERKKQIKFWNAYFVFLIFISIIVLCTFPGDSKAKVTGVCANCHTMHASQEGTSEGAESPIIFGEESSLPNPSLTKSDCVGCHSSTDSDTIKYIGGLPGDPETSKVPIVYNTMEPSTPLAGGNFYWIEHVNDNRGHNIFPDNPDDDLTEAPGLGSGDFETCGTNNCHANLSQEFTDSPTPNYLEGRYGCLGCHMVSGFNQFSETKAWHHSNDSDTVVDSAEEGWFRFLSGHISGYTYGVAGIEDDDWHYTESTSDHNEYLGKQVSPRQGSFNAIQANTMTAFCCGCHGRFHRKGPSGKWKRHPIDRRIPNDGEYGSYTVYDPIVPVARPDISGWSGPSATVNEGGSEEKDMVMCLSCHRAHGSPYPDMLRWDYDAMIAGGGDNASGCFTCHSNKDTGGS